MIIIIFLSVKIYIKKVNQRKFRKKTEEKSKIISNIFAQILTINTFALKLSQNISSQILDKEFFNQILTSKICLIRFWQTKYFLSKYHIPNIFGQNIFSLRFWWKKDFSVKSWHPKYLCSNSDSPIIFAQILTIKIFSLRFWQIKYFRWLWQSNYFHPKSVEKCLTIFCELKFFYSGFDNQNIFQLISNQ